MKKAGQLAHCERIGYITGTVSRLFTDYRPRSRYTKLTTLDAPDPEETEINSMEQGFADHDGIEKVDLGAGDSASSTVNVIPTLEKNPYSSNFNARKRQTIQVPMV